MPPPRVKYGVMLRTVARSTFAATDAVTSRHEPVVGVVVATTVRFVNGPDARSSVIVATKLARVVSTELANDGGMLVELDETSTPSSIQTCAAVRNRSRPPAVELLCALRPIAAMAPS